MESAMVARPPSPRDGGCPSSGQGSRARPPSGGAPVLLELSRVLLELSSVLLEHFPVLLGDFHVLLGLSDVLLGHFHVLLGVPSVLLAARPPPEREAGDDSAQREDLRAIGIVLKCRLIKAISPRDPVRTGAQRC
jgi:hypothetical protein